MVTIVNNRRRAANAISYVNLTPKPPTYMSKKRKLLIPELTVHEKAMLELFKCDNGKDESDVYTVFLCRPDNYSARKSVQTDIPPILIAESIGGLNQLDSDGKIFGMPTHTIQTKSWKDNLPKFDHYVTSMSRYPNLSIDSKTIVRSLTHSNSVKNLSNIDYVETYLSIFHGTLMEFFRTGTLKYATLCWKILHSIRYFIKKLGPTQPPTQEQINILRDLYKKRDIFLDCAIEFKKFIATLHPAQYYLAMYKLMESDGDIVHRSRVPNIEMLIWGYLTTHLCPKESIPSLNSLSKHFLALFLDQGLKGAAGLPSNHQCVEKDQLIAFCHERMGTRLQNSLRYACFMWKCLEPIQNCNHVQMESFECHLNALRTQLYSVEGFTPFCVLFCPETTLTDAVLADLWIGAGLVSKNLVVDDDDIKLSDGDDQSKFKFFPGKPNIEILKLEK